MHSISDTSMETEAEAMVAESSSSQPVAENLMESVQWLGQARREHKQLLVRFFFLALCGH
jgi:hypothetical protein